VSFPDYGIIAIIKFIFGSYVADNGTVAGCPEKKAFCLSSPCSHGAKCTDGWGTYLCECLEGWSDKDCSQGKMLTFWADFLNLLLVSFYSLKFVDVLNQCCSKINILRDCEEKDLEISAGELETTASKLITLSLYRVPTAKNN
jgi:hypothetical protein